MLAAYDRKYNTSQFEGMAPGRIVLALYDGALASMERAALAVERQNVPERGQAISKAVAIVGELQAALNMDAELEIAEHLHALYDYLVRELVKANLRADAALIRHCEAVLREVREGWAEMLVQQQREVPKAANAEGGYL